jgi:hypothetical protein
MVMVVACEEKKDKINLMRSLAASFLEKSNFPKLQSLMILGGEYFWSWSGRVCSSGA